MNYSEVQYARKTGAAATGFTLQCPHSVTMWIYEVRIHLGSAATQEDFDIWINSSTAAAYDVKLYSQDMSGLTDFVWRPDQPVPIAPGDVLTADWDNTDTATYGIEVLYGF